MIYYVFEFILYVFKLILYVFKISFLQPVNKAYFKYFLHGVITGWFQVK